MKRSTLNRFVTPAVLLGLNAGLLHVAHAQRGVTQDDRAARREQRRQQWEKMTPEQRQQFIQQRRQEFQQRLANMTPGQRAEWEKRQQQRRQQWLQQLPADQRAAIEQRMKEQQAKDTAERAQLGEVGADQATQDALLRFQRRQQFARMGLLRQAQATANAIRDKNITDDQLAKQLADFRNAVADDNVRYENELQELDKQIGYSKKPKLEAYLTLSEVVGDESYAVGGPQAIFLTEAKQEADAAAKEKQQRTFMTALGFTDTATQDAVVEFLRQQKLARQPLLKSAQELATAIKDKNSTDEQITAQLMAFRKAAADDKARNDNELQALEKKINYSTKPRLETFLTMVEIVGGESYVVGGPQAIFGAPVQNFGGRGGNGGNWGRNGRNGGGNNNNAAPTPKP